MICLIFKQILVRLGEDTEPVDKTWNTSMQKQVRKVICGLKGNLIDML